MKKFLVLLIVMLFALSAFAIAEEAQQEKESKGFFAWLTKLFGKGQATENQATESQQPEEETILKELPEEIILEKVSSNDVSSKECNVVICVSGKKEIHCTESYSACVDQYYNCRIVSCDEELAEDAPCIPQKQDSSCKETRNLCKTELKTGTTPSTMKLICLGDYNDCRLKYGDCECGAPAEDAECCCLTPGGAYRDIPVMECGTCLPDSKCEPSVQEAAQKCDEKKNTCYYQTEAVQTDKQYLPPVMVAFTCQGSFTDCQARYQKCECGIKTDACAEDTHTCRKGTGLFECSGTLDFCLRKYEDCTCGLIYGCSASTHNCFIQGKQHRCSGEYPVCARQYDQCMCGKLTSVCTERKHNCYDSPQDTTTYAGPVMTECPGFYDECVQKHDWCECGTSSAGDYSCPLTQNTCRRDNGSTFICNGDLKSCEKKYGKCECGVTGDERSIKA